MKKKITIEADFCDNCDKQTYVKRCLNCGVEHCYDCIERHGVGNIYSSKCYSGYKEIYYCNACSNALIKTNDNLFHAYKKIKSLENEANEWRQDFDKRVNEAENEIKKLREQLGLNN